MMKNAIPSIRYLLFTLLLPLFFSANTLFAEQKATAKIRFIERIHAFGVVPPDATLKCTFIFTNTGTAPLSIDRLESSCGCLAIQSAPGQVLPGQSAEIAVSLETGSTEGMQTKEILVLSNDPDEPRITLTITCDVRKKYALLPEVLYMGEVDKGTTLTKTVKLLQAGKEALLLDRVETHTPFLAAAFAGYRDNREQGYMINITLGAGAAIGEYTETVTLHTNLPAHPRIDIPVWFTVRGRIHVSPAMLALGTLQKGAKADKRLTLRAKDQKPFLITGITADPPCLLIEVLAFNVKPAGEKYTLENAGKDLSADQPASNMNKSDDTQYELSVTIDAKAPAGNFNGTINIYTDDPEQALLTVAVSGLIKK